MLTHYPRRDWCEYCIAGAKKNLPHRSIKAAKEGLPAIAFDYCFVRQEGEEDLVTVLVMRDCHTRVTFANVVFSKGRGHDECVVDVALDNIRKLGYDAIVLQTDQEPAIRDLAQGIAEKRNKHTLLREAPRYEHQSNGAIEKGVQEIEDQIRILLLALGKRLGKTIPTRHPCVAWLVEHAASLYTKYHVGTDGMSAWRRLFGKDPHGTIVEFGESVLFRAPGDSRDRPKLGARYLPGVWLGRRWGSTEHLVIGPDGCACTCWALQRLPFSERWRAASVEGITALPWRWKPLHPADQLAPGVVFRDLHVGLSASPRRTSIALVTLWVASGARPICQGDLALVSRTVSSAEPASRQPFGTLATSGWHARSNAKISTLPTTLPVMMLPRLPGQEEEGKGEAKVLAVLVKMLLLALHLCLQMVLFSPMATLPCMQYRAAI